MYTILTVNSPLHISLLTHYFFRISGFKSTLHARNFNTPESPKTGSLFVWGKQRPKKFPNRTLQERELYKIHIHSFHGFFKNTNLDKILVLDYTVGLILQNDFLQLPNVVWEILFQLTSRVFRLHHTSGNSMKSLIKHVMGFWTKKVCFLIRKHNVGFTIKRKCGKVCTTFFSTQGSNKMIYTFIY